MWVAAEVEGDVIYNWDETKEALVAERIIPLLFKGLLQCDGGSEIECYLEGGKARVKPPPKERIIRLGCWAHVRRKFFQAAQDGCLQAKWLLKRINLLYRIERVAREAGMDTPTRQALRQKRSRRVLKRLKTRLDKLQCEGLLLPRSPVMKAVTYTLGQWESLQHYIDHGVAEIDNNWVENAIRPCAVGKKNWLFIGNVAAGQRAAILYSILGSCLRRGLNPRAYLMWLFERLPTATTKTITQLTPAAYTKCLAAASTPATDSNSESNVA
jgi:transposase